MRLRFSSSGDDEDAYYATRDALVDEFGGWLDGPEPERAALVGDVGVFLDWRYHYSSGVLDEFAGGDITEFLLEWCPRKLSAPAEDAEGICQAVGAYLEFMAQTNRLVGGVDRAAALITLADDLIPTMRAEMDNPANFGMAKALFAGLGDVSGLSEEELLSALQARMDEHNALPFEERKALTDKFINPDPEPYELPFVYVPPLAADVDAAVAAAPLPAKVDALRGYLGVSGKPLTDKGNLKLADGRALIELLDTGDVMDPQIGDKTFRTVSTAELSRLMFLVDVAKRAGAVRVHQRRLVPTKAWATRPPVQQATALVATIIELGPLQSLSSGRIWLFNELHQLLDDGIVLWLSPLLGPRTEGPFEDLVELPKVVVAQQLAPYWPERSKDSIDEFTVRDMGRIFELLELAGAVQWTDRIEVPNPYGRSSWAGGTVGLTALGRRVLPDYVDDAGLVLHRVADLSGADGTALVDAMLSVAESQRPAVLAAWQPDRSLAERAQMLTETIASSDSAEVRTIGFDTLDLFGIDVVEPLVRQLLDTTVAGYAALWLMVHGRADRATVGSFVDTAALVDLLAGLLDDPDALCDMFTTAPDADPGQPYTMLDEMWRQPTRETALVLDALGQHLKDRKLAKAARKAAMRHRSWMANRE
jgi:hypothetical protein